MLRAAIWKLLRRWFLIRDRTLNSFSSNLWSKSKKKSEGNWRLNCNVPSPCSSQNFCHLSSPDPSFQRRTLNRNRVRRSQTKRWQWSWTIWIGLTEKQSFDFSSQKWIQDKLPPIGEIPSKNKVVVDSHAQLEQVAAKTIWTKLLERRTTRKITGMKMMASIITITSIKMWWRGLNTKTTGTWWGVTIRTMARATTKTNNITIRRRSSHKIAEHDIEFIRLYTGWAGLGRGLIWERSTPNVHTIIHT